MCQNKGLTIQSHFILNSLSTELMKSQSFFFHSAVAAAVCVGRVQSQLVDVDGRFMHISSILIVVRFMFYYQIEYLIGPSDAMQSVGLCSVAKM